MANKSSNSDNIFLGIRVIPWVSNLGVFLVIIGILSLIMIMVAKSIMFLFYGLAFLALGLLFSFAPKYLKIDYANKSIRHYFNWGILKVGKPIPIINFDEIGVIKFDRAYRSTSLYHGEERQSITYEIYLKSSTDNSRLMLCEFSDSEKAMEFAIKYGNKLGVEVKGKVVDAFRAKRKPKKASSRR